MALLSNLYLILVLRLAHIAGGILWVGGAILYLYLLIPAAASAESAGKKFMQTLGPRFGMLMRIVTTVTLISGILLYARFFSGGISFIWATGAAAAFTLGALAALVSYGMGVGIFGPTQGKIRRPSDGKVPKEIVFVKCVASRDPERYMPYCSRVCCMVTAKQATLYKKQVPDGQPYIFYMDIRWYAHYDESGGRVLGEACHFLEYFWWLFEPEPVQVLAQTTWPPAGRLPFPDSVTAQVEFADGSCGQLIYSAEGDPTWPKETLTIFGSGLVAEIVNFQRLTVHRGRKRTTLGCRSKGHAEEMSAWASYLRGEQSHPLPYEQAQRSMRLTFAVLDSIRNKGPAALSETAP